MRFLAAFLLCLVLPYAAYSDGLWNKLKKGAVDTGEAIGETADDVGHVAGDVAAKAGEALGGAATAVGETVTSTTEMVGDEDTPELTRQRIDGVASESIEKLFATNEEAKLLFTLSFGYAVFDARQLTVIGATGGYGRGVAIDKATDARTYMRMGTGGVGLSFGVGGFDRKVIMLFEDETQFLQFVENGYDATAQTGAMVGDDKKSEEVRFIDGRSIFVLTKNGWKVSATAAGTKYWKDADLN